jgi:flagellar biosynthesis anti-sigma factor FlgM
MDITKVRNDKVQETGVASSKLVSTQKSRSLESSERAAGTASDEQVKWSPDAHLMTDALGEVKASADVRASRVAELKAKIKDGTYAMDAQKIAERMIESSLEDSLLSRRV